MASNSTVTITFAMKEAGDGMKQLSLSATNLQKVMEASVSESRKLNDSILSFAGLVTGLDSLSNTFKNIQGVCSELTGAYAAQVQAETQLAVTMRNSMGARQEDIQSIKDLCSAQQQIGIIGDEVQLAGAQEMATYLGEKASLEQLIPVMNDMLAQQYGINATQENAAQIATMLGKVMNGQTGALSRYGYTFDEAQEKILKYGTEAQRAATLCDVVSASVGGMNAELAKTDIGKMKQFENNLGDVKEQIGGVVQNAMKFVNGFNEVSEAASGAIKILKGFDVAKGYVINMANSIKATVAASNALTSSSGGVAKALGTARLFVVQFGQALTGGIKGLKLFCIAWKGMLISTGIGLAIAAVTSIIAYFALKTDEATESTNKLISAEERAKRAAEEAEEARQNEARAFQDANAALQLNIARLKNWNGSKEEEKRLVNEMNSTYGETMGYFDSASQWYDTLVANSEAYCRQLVLEAKARNLANQIAAAEQEAYDIRYDEQGNTRKYSTKRETKTVHHAVNQSTWTEEVEIEGSSDKEKAQKAYEDSIAKQKNLNKRMNDTLKESASIKMPVVGSKTPPKTTTVPQGTPEPVIREDAATIAEYEESIRAIDQQRRTANEDELRRLNTLRAAQEAELARLRDLGTEEQKKTAVFNENAQTIREYADNVRYLEEQINDASGDQLTELNRQLEEQRKRISELRSQGIEKPEPADSDNLEPETPKFDASASTLKAINDNLSILQAKLQDASVEEAALINQQIDLWQQKADAIQNAGKAYVDVFGSVRSGWGNIEGMTQSIESMNQALRENGTIWEKTQAIVDGFFQLFDSISGIISLINTLVEVTRSHADAKREETTETEASAIATGISAAATAIDATATGADAIATEADTTATSENTSETNANTIATGANAMANAVNSGASMPFPANIAAIAAGVAAVVGILASVGCFATGGIVGGASPSGDRLIARVNSGEMILNMTQQRNLFRMLNMPSALRGVSVAAPQPANVQPDTVTMIQLADNAAGAGGEVRFRIDGRTLVGVLAKESNLNMRR